MRILFTGASSFTGMWFARELAAAGHAVTATFRRRPDEYTDEPRRRRVALVAECCQPVYDISFGDDRFLSLVREQSWDLLAHHAADVTNYRSPQFEVLTAVERNAHRLPELLQALEASGCTRVLLTGSVFEGGEGAGSEGLPHVSPYGLSKAITSQLFRFYCERAGASLGKFVIPNPFGPFEEPRFTAYLIKAWLEGKTPSCNSPLYVRDNIHVGLLAKAYVRFAKGMPAAPGFTRLNPSGYVESQGAFVQRVAEEMRPRLGVPCRYELKEQVEFEEPRVRINTDAIDRRALAWDDSAAWEEVARYYRNGSSR